MSEFSVGDRVLVPGVVMSINQYDVARFRTGTGGEMWVPLDLLRPDTGGRDLTAEDVESALGNYLEDLTYLHVAERLTRIARGDAGSAQALSSSAGDDTAPPAEPPRSDDGTDLRELRIHVCESCIARKPGTCHVPGCFYIRHTSDEVPTHLEYYAAAPPNAPRVMCPHCRDTFGPDDMTDGDVAEVVCSMCAKAGRRAATGPRADDGPYERQCRADTGSGDVPPMPERARRWAVAVEQTWIDDEPRDALAAAWEAGYVSATFRRGAVLDGCDTTPGPRDGVPAPWAGADEARALRGEELDGDAPDLPDHEAVGTVRREVARAQARFEFGAYIKTPVLAHVADLAERAVAAPRAGVDAPDGALGAPVVALLAVLRTVEDVAKVCVTAGLDVPGPSIFGDAAGSVRIYTDDDGLTIVGRADTEDEWGQVWSWGAPSSLLTAAIEAARTPEATP